MNRCCASDRKKRIAAYPLATLRECLVGLVLPEVAVAACEAAGLSLDVRVDEVAARRAACALKRIPFTVHRAAPYRPCQVSRGGLSLEGFDPSSMKSAAHPRKVSDSALGEALDVDGPCGGTTSTGHGKAGSSQGSMQEGAWTSAPDAFSTSRFPSMRRWVDRSLAARAAKILGIDESGVASCSLTKRSVDARKKDRVHFARFF